MEEESYKVGQLVQSRGLTTVKVSLKSHNKSSYDLKEVVLFCSLRKLQTLPYLRSLISPLCPGGKLFIQAWPSSSFERTVTCNSEATSLKKISTARVTFTSLYPRTSTCHMINHSRSTLVSHEVERGNVTRTPIHTPFSNFENNDSTVYQRTQLHCLSEDTTALSIRGHNCTVYQDDLGLFLDCVYLALLLYSQLSSGRLGVLVDHTCVAVPGRNQ